MAPAVRGACRITDTGDIPAESPHPSIRNDPVIIKSIPL